MRADPIWTAAPRRKTGDSRRQSGVGMIEILVALLLVSLGLLGIGGLTAATFGYNKVAQLRLTGLNLVNDYADRARLNIYGYDLGSYAIALSDAAPTTQEMADATTAMKADEAVAVTAARNVATFDRLLFQRTVANRLPQGRVVVVTTPTNQVRNLDVWLLWQEPTTRVGDALFAAGQFNCPSDLTDDEKTIYSCMYFKVGL
ncbi:type IV pilus modification protein PilV [Hydrogenophaga sp. BPS33]|uniref:type IV pilus modification protein PilV n=1 Tax=Hydrogenophaga sp. BPS33 TaxID=2651974 RepID=UPI00131FFE7C|nr:type IV pilus modification protein PilV [Hydrogenophaga sp. BPS33]QHE86829.1 type IV pilus modification protein PilV [Hydrogenophaga sp. BPS33]